MLYKAVFKNSKVALLFAVMTIMSAVSMVGTSEDGGPLVTAVSEAHAKRQAADAARDAQSAPPPSVFGDYDPQEAASAPAPGPAPDYASDLPSDEMPYAEAADPGQPDPSAAYMPTE